MGHASCRSRLGLVFSDRVGPAAGCQDPRSPCLDRQPEFKCDDGSASVWESKVRAISVPFMDICNNSDFGRGDRALLNHGNKVEFQTENHLNYLLQLK